MAKLTLTDITSGYASTTGLNTAFAAIEAALENTLSRDGTSPNQMSANLDLNGYAILNARATSGNENFLWLGTWVTGASYVVNNLVYAPAGTNEGATLICITAHTAGATLDGDAAKWAVFAQRGAGGAGTGDVVGPASSTVGSLARFSDTTGKLLKDGAVIGVDVQAYSANLAALSSRSVGTASGNIPVVGTKSATTTLAGLVEQATQAEAVAGVDDTVFPSVLGVAQEIAALQTSMITFASNGIAAGAIEYMGPSSSSASAAKANMVMPFACTLKNMYVVAETAPGAGQNNVYTLFKNGVGQTLAATMADTASTASDTSNSVTFVAGDTVTVRLVLSGSSLSTTTHHVGIEVAP